MPTERIYIGRQRRVLLIYHPRLLRHTDLKRVPHFSDQPMLGNSLKHIRDLRTSRPDPLLLTFRDQEIV